MAQNMTKAALEERVALLERLLAQAIVVIDRQRAELEVIAVRKQSVGPTHRLRSRFSNACYACGEDIEKDTWIAWAPRKAWHHRCVDDGLWHDLPLLEMRNGR